MKKFLSLALALVLCLSLSVTAFAASPLDDADNDTSNGTTGNNSDTRGVVVGVANIQEPAIVYYVVVTWGTPVFTYTKTAQTWDQESLTYTGTPTGSWALTSATGSDKINVENRSNAAVAVNISATMKTSTDIAGIGGTGITFDKSTFNLATAVGKDEQTVPSNTFTVDVTGDPTASFTQAVIANMTVTIGAGTITEGV